MIFAENWRKKMANGLSDFELWRGRLSSLTGRPLSDDSFLSEIKQLINKRVCPLPVERLKKKINLVDE
jgi:hypothetical protein